MARCESRVRSRALLVSEVALFSSLLIVTRLFKLGLHIPGSGSMPWIAVLLIARGISSYPVTATLVGLVSGIVVTVAGIDLPPGPHQILKIALAGVIVDVFGYLVLRRSHNPITYGMAGGAASLAKLFTVYLIALVLNIPVFVIKAILAYVMALNFVFGVIAGVIAYYIIRFSATVIKGEEARS